MIEQLTPEQEKLIPVYREKWRNITFSTDAIDVEQVKDIIIALYTRLNRKIPDILFFKNPIAAMEKLGEYSALSVDLKIQGKFNMIPTLWEDDSLEEDDQNDSIAEIASLEDYLHIFISSQLDREIYKGLYHNIDLDMYMIYDDVAPTENALIFDFDFIECPETLIEAMAVFDFCISVLGCTYPEKEWKLLQDFARFCHWLYPFENICGFTDRPSILSLDRHNSFHAEGKPALQYRDGLTFYCHHGISLPERYGKVHSSQWRSQWLLSEENAELRRILIQVIGYDRICQELNAIALDSWQEYTLLRIDSQIDIEPICLLKMTCPSTGYIHSIRVPPDIATAKAAITWVNWGISPDEFAIQT